jgi:hypothetical protein
MPAAAALGITTTDTFRLPQALRSAPIAVSDCLFAVAWSGCYRHLVSDAWSWEVPVHDAARVGRAAAGDALRPVHARLDRQAHELAAQLLAVSTSRTRPEKAWVF